ncbi:hypothetical protein PFICI_04577 [Pestalotiopsis fici W106-1]|uniref:Zn(2)-C6 fungal-type domain-containing protein n=1 Tax=Pestalotiopsis fici (strain W106-1 / CGMCC3.15140) TaxID=1229662 RepID=W3XC08_PESFW|nr:uncharacterized protein PFICI_04577 [Pestalotiopsis fici W106-1]ETS82701.1 hypothetical protein PFICI_04577 [Pestalotiopsis fici W106-1]
MDVSAPRDNPIDSIHSQSQAQKGLVRNQIACERCRLHKQKCDGASPCSKCAQRGVTCAYRVKKRPRRKRAVALPRQGTAASTAASTAAELCSLFPRVRASQDLPGKSFSELYYGPSSNFSLMQQLYRQLSHHHGVGLQPSPGYVQDAGDGLDEFHYRNVCFHSQLANLDRPPYENAPNDPPRYLDAYFETIGVLFPIVREEDLRARLPHLEALDGLALAPLHRAVLLAALATGALFCGARDEGEGLLQMAHQIADEYRHIINNEVVIFNFLMISRFFCLPEDKTRTFAKFLAHALFYDCTGRYNLAYLHNGHACRAAHAVGLHQTSWTSNSMASDPLGPTVYCALFVQER